MGSLEANAGLFWRYSLISDSQDLPPTRLKLLELLDDPPTQRKLKIELAVSVDAGEPFVKAMYQLEGDGPFVFSAYEEICKLRATISNEYYPNVSAVAKDLSTVFVTIYSAHEICVKPGYEYFEEKFSEDWLLLFHCLNVHAYLILQRSSTLVLQLMKSNNYLFFCL